MVIKCADHVQTKQGNLVDIHVLLEKAAAYHKKGNWDKAQRFYLKALKVAPTHPDALHLYGLLCQQKGDNVRAVKYLKRAIQNNPHNALMHLHLGSVLQALHHDSDAEASYLCCIAIDEQVFQAYFNLALICDGEDRVEEAAQYYRKAISKNANFVEAYNNLGNLYQRLGRHSEAIEQYEMATQLQPTFHAAYNNIGNVHLHEKNWELALNYFQRALDLASDNMQYKANMAAALTKMGKLSVAAQLLTDCVQTGGCAAQVYNNLASICLQQGSLSLARQHLQACLAANPEFVPAISNLASAYLKEGLSAETIALLEEKIPLCDERAELYDGLANAYRMQGDIDKAIDIFQQAITLEPSMNAVYSNYLLTLNYAEDWRPREVFQAHLQWGQFVSDVCSWDAREGLAAKPRIRVGFLSPDLRLHSVSYFLAALFEHYSRDRFEFVCYADVFAEDEVSERFRGWVDRWINVAGISDLALTKSLRDDQLDVLVDLTGHSANNRLMVFARQAAPIQISYLGYPNTTGLTTMHYRLTDACADPRESAEVHTEQLLYLQSSFLCYTPPAQLPDIDSCPVLDNGYVTFGSFNNIAKLGPSVIQLWSEILLAVPASRLFLKSKSFSDSVVRERIMSAFEHHGVSGERLCFAEFKSTTDEHLRAYACVDIALDPFPYNGTTTTFEALVMGVPVITLRGDRHAARVGYSILHNLHSSDWVADGLDDYHRIAVEMAADLPRLQALRHALRERLLSSTLTDGKQFTGDFESVLAQVVAN